MDVPHPPVSDRLQLEIAVIHVTAEPASKAAPAESLGAPGAPGYRVLLLVTEPDLREYIRECLGERTDVRVFELGPPGEPGREALTGMHPDLIIADTSLCANRPHELERSMVPLLLIGHEQPDHLPASHVSPRRSMEVLVEPFNARRLLETVYRLGLHR